MQRKSTTKPENLLHRTFNRLTAIGIAGHTKSKAVRWLWRCTCGNFKLATANNVKGSITRSCGCIRGKAGVKGHRGTPEYCAWSNIIQRCTNPKCRAYAQYGGRGITVCDRWKDAANFLADMGKKPTPEHTIERINNNKGYSPENCKWATRKEQQSNRRISRLLTFRGETFCVNEWARRLNMHSTTISGRLKHGWPIERALTEPPKSNPTKHR